MRSGGPGRRWRADRVLMTNVGSEQWADDRSVGGQDGGQEVDSVRSDSGSDDRSEGGQKTGQVYGQEVDSVRSGQWSCQVENVR